jgi:hypothetical protein
MTRQVQNSGTIPALDVEFQGHVKVVCWTLDTTFFTLDHVLVFSHILTRSRASEI